MKLSERWLRTWVNPNLASQQLAEQLTLAGLEVESFTDVVRGSLDRVVVGRVESIAGHPNADRLRVCRVTIGEDRELSIVCGARNVCEGWAVAVALEGAVLPTGLTIKAEKIRSILSQGMLCSSYELGLTEAAEGIMELPLEAKGGDSVLEWLELPDRCFAIHVPPNRGDCLSIAGIARELAALNNLSIQKPLFNRVSPTCLDQLPIRIADPRACPRYLARILSGINIAARTPVWMQERLRRSGFHCLHPVVDVTNYVLLEMGQPLHAFDRNRIQEEIHVRWALEGEKLKLLNGKDISLKSGTLVIADAVGVQALAGVMGGSGAAITDSTETILLESAFFTPSALAGCARRYGLDTEAAYRFERGVDPQGCRLALERATDLLLAICGGKAGPVADVTTPSFLPSRKAITLRRARIQVLLGIYLTDPEIESILKRLSMRVKPNAEGWEICVPSWRFDCQIEADLVEELARIHGFEGIASQLPEVPLSISPLPEETQPLNRLRYFWADRGYHEAITYSFTSLKWQQWIEPHVSPLSLCNPLSSELSVLRSSLWSTLLQMVAYNQNRQQWRVRLFEIGPRFLKTQDGVQEESVLAGVAAGFVYPEQWGVSSRKVDFFDVKGDVEACLALLKQTAIDFIPGKHPALHPGQTSALILPDHTVVGYLGALHPRLAAECDLVEPIYLFEYCLDHLRKNSLPAFRLFSKFPFVRRDISFWVSDSVAFSDIQTTVRAKAGNYLVNFFLFDVHADLKAFPEQRSLALGLLWQHPTRTLIQDEVETWLNRVIAALQQRFAIQFREGVTSSLPKSG